MRERVCGRYLLLGICISNEKFNSRSIRLSLSLSYCIAANLHFLPGRDRNLSLSLFKLPSFCRLARDAMRTVVYNYHYWNGNEESATFQNFFIISTIDSKKKKKTATRVHLLVTCKKKKKR